jgi:SAM-dependent methyltransferase
MYHQSRDPWNFAQSEYERGRYRATLDALLRPSYRRAFEPGCSIGELTALMALRCDRVVATDVAPSAVAVAKERCRGLRNVDVYQADLANGLPNGPFDLIVMSEVGYYFEPRVLAAIATATAAQLEPGGEFVAVHWLGHSDDHVLGGEALKVRHLTEQACTDVLNRFGRATGPQLLAYDAQIARQHMALTLYIRQCHAERDLETIAD